MNSDLTYDVKSELNYLNTTKNGQFFLLGQTCIQ